MHRSEADQAGSCAACGAAVTTSERIYAFGNDDILCFRCAVDRGGCYDQLTDDWDVRPRIADLLARSAREA